jgi:restriction system protein
VIKGYYRVILGRKNVYATECFAGGFIGAGFDVHEDLSTKLPEQWRDFNKQFIPIILAQHPERSKISAGLACGALWTICKGIKVGDIVLSPDGTGTYHVGEVASDYYHMPGQAVPHRRKVNWSAASIPRTSMSAELKHSTGSIGTVCEITDYAPELQKLLTDTPIKTIVSLDPEIEDAATFALEEHLEDFIIENWSQTILSKDFNLYEEDGVPSQQFPTDAGRIDILAVSKDKKRLLVIELKRGRASDAVVGQTLRYMGYVKEQISIADCCCVYPWARMNRRCSRLLPNGTGIR